MVWNVAMLLYFDIDYTTGHSESRAVLLLSFFSLGQIIKSSPKPNLGTQCDRTCLNLHCNKKNEGCVVNNDY